jgi:predicted AAA+ superfamily ATPase
LLEGWVAMLLRAYGDPDFGLGERFDGLFYWAPNGPGDVEVDFVILRGNAAVAIEVKAKTTISGRDLKGLRAVAPLPGLTRRIVVFLGERPSRTADGIDVLPVAQFVREVEAGEL